MTTKTKTKTKTTETVVVVSADEASAYQEARGGFLQACFEAYNRTESGNVHAAVAAYGEHGVTLAQNDWHKGRFLAIVTNAMSVATLLNLATITTIGKSAKACEDIAGLSADELVRLYGANVKHEGPKSTTSAKTSRYVKQITAISVDKLTVKQTAKVVAALQAKIDEIQG